METPLQCASTHQSIACGSTWWIQRLEVQVTAESLLAAGGHVPIPIVQRTVLVCAQCGARP